MSQKNISTTWCSHQQVELRWLSVPGFLHTYCWELWPNSSILVSSDQKLSCLSRLSAFWQTPSRLWALGEEWRNGLHTVTLTYSPDWWSDNTDLRPSKSMGLTILSTVWLAGHFSHMPSTVRAPHLGTGKLKSSRKSISRIIDSNRLSKI